MDLLKLKSGTDIRGTALEGYGEKVDLTDDNIELIAQAFCVFLRKRNSQAKSIAVGHDSRLSADRISRILKEVFTKSGFNVFDCGLCSTPSMFMMTVYSETKADASVMITASHHPAQKNGLKFFLPEGGVSGKDIAEILKLAETSQKIDADEKGIILSNDYMALYCEFLKNKIKEQCKDEKPLKGLKIVVDAGNGAGGFYAERVLKPLGADIGGSQFLEPDGTFPNHAPNPENKEAMKAICDCTIKNKADLGIIFDTDVDRAAIVSSNGEEINRNRLIALLSEIVLRENKGATIVTDSVTSDGLAQFIKSKNGVHHRFKRGYRNVIDEAIRLEGEGINAPLAIETSGHAALKSNYFLDDGAFVVTEIIIELVRLKKLGKEIDSLIASLETAIEELEVRLTFTVDEFKRLGDFIIESFKEYKNEQLVLADDNYEGVRFSVPSLKGWFLIRMSVHDPIMPINIESNVKGGAKKIAKLVYAYLSAYKGLDTSNLKKVL